MNQQHSNPYGYGERGGSQIDSSSASSLPGALQAGRPAPATANTAPSTVPVLPALSTQSQQQTPSRGSTVSQSHSYSRSSPAAATPSNKYMSTQTPQTSAYSPLGLADIRSRADSGLSDGTLNPGHSPDFATETGNSSYLAPWAVYAFDWCKWPVRQQGIGESAGKMAIGSYLEDGHNYVSIQK